MKKHFLISALMIILAGLTFSAKAQSDKDGDKEKEELPMLLQKDAETGSWQYSEVINFDSTKMTQTDVYKNTKNYLLSTLKTGDNNIVADDQTASKLINTGNLILKPMTGFGYAINNASVDFKIKVSFKSGRYKILIDNVVFHAIYSTGTTTMPVTQTYDEIKNNKAGKKFKSNVNETLTAFVNGMKDAAANKNGAKDDKW